MKATVIQRPEAPDSAAVRGEDGQSPRRHVRLDTLKHAQVVVDDAVLDCVLLDLSEGGAHVFLLAHAELPDRVTLWLPSGEGRSIRCRWQQGSHIGLEAVAEDAGEAPPA